MRDLRTDESFVISDRVASRQVRAGELLCTRLAPTGDDRRIIGGAERVAEEQRDALLELLDDPDLDPGVLLDRLSGGTD